VLVIGQWLFELGTKVLKKGMLDMHKNSWVSHGHLGVLSLIYYRKLSIIEQSMIFVGRQIFVVH